jgi:hypothetical protein
MGTLDSKYFTPALSKGQGGSTVCTGIVDELSRKCLPFSIKALIHFSRDRLHLFTEDLFLDERTDE